LEELSKEIEKTEKTLQEDKKKITEKEKFLADKKNEISKSADNLKNGKVKSKQITVKRMKDGVTSKIDKNGKVIY